MVKYISFYVHIRPINYGPPQYQRLFPCLFFNSSWTLGRFYPPQAVVTERSDVVPCSPPVRALIFYRAYEGWAWPMLLTRAFFRAFRESFFFSTRKFPYEYALSDTWTHEIDPSVRSGYADHLPSHRGRRPMTVQRQGLEDGIHTCVMCERIPRYIRGVFSFSFFYVCLL